MVVFVPSSMPSSASSELIRVPTGIEGFDQLAGGGLPQGRTCLIAGTAGCGKTVFAAHFLATGVQQGEGAVFVTFEESPADLRQNLTSLGWPIEAWEKQGRWAFVDVSPDPETAVLVGEDFELTALVARIENAVRKTDARRVSIDSLGSIYGQLPRTAGLRRELFHLAASLRRLGVTCVLTAERDSDEAGVTRMGVDEFVADNVVLLRNQADHDKRRRTVEILKFRGSNHYKGRCPFTILAGRGAVVIPLATMELNQPAQKRRISLGVPGLDDLCGGGLFQDSITLLSGPTGTGKTLTSMHYLSEGARRGEKGLMFAFEESPEQLLHNCSEWNVNVRELVKQGTLKLSSCYPEAASIDEHLLRIRAEMLAFAPSRVVVDSLSALGRVASERAFREFAISLCDEMRRMGVSTVLTSTTTGRTGLEHVLEGNLSTLTDSIILLRFVEMYGELRKGVTALKVRGSAHASAIFEYSIDARGVRIGQPFQNVTGIMGGHQLVLDQRALLQIDKDRARA